MVWCPTGYHWHCNWPVQKVSPGMCPCKWWTVEHFLWTNSCKQFAFLIFHAFLAQVASVHRVRFLLCWCLMVDKRTLLNCKALIKLVKDSERTKSKMSLLPAALRAEQICRYFVYSEADFEVFRPGGATRCTDGGWNLAWRSGPKVPSSVPNFTPIGATTRV